MIHKIIASFILLSAGVAIAADSTDRELPERLRKLDQRVQFIKQRAIDISGNLQDAKEAITLDTDERLDVFFSLNLDDRYVPTTLELRLNNELVSEHRFTAAEVSALHDGGARLMYQANLAEMGNSAPSLAGFLRGYYNNTSGPTEPQTQAFDQDLDFSNGPQVIELVVQDTTSYQVPALIPTVVTDELDETHLNPYVSSALFEYYSGSYVEAISHLYAAEKRNKTANSPNAAKLHKAHLYLGYGLHHDASKLYWEVLSAAPETRMDQNLWFNMARSQFERGYLGLTGLVEYALSRIQDNAPEELTSQKTLLLGQLYMAQGRHKEAIELLYRWSGPKEDEGFAQYNLGIARIQSGDIKGGAAILDLLGTRSVYSEEQAALRDQANLALAYAFLQTEHGGTAANILQRIRLDGHHANRALLAAGWAEVEPVGDFQLLDNIDRRGCLPIEINQIGSLGGVRRAPKEGCATAQVKAKRELKTREDGAGWRRALVPWLHLARRNPGDTSVQEVQLAIPYAFEKLKAPELALKHYNSAIELFKNQSAELDELAAQAEKGTLTDILLTHIQTNNDVALSKLPENSGLRRIWLRLTMHDIQVVLNNHHNLDKLTEQAEQWSTHVRQLRSQLDDAYWIITKKQYELLDQLDKTEIALAELKQQIESVRKNQRTFIKDMIAEEFSRQRKQVITYITKSRLGIADIYDQTAKDADKAQNAKDDSE